MGRVASSFWLGDNTRRKSAGQESTWVHKLGAGRGLARPCPRPQVGAGLSHFKPAWRSGGVVLAWSPLQPAADLQPRPTVAGNRKCKSRSLVGRRGKGRAAVAPSRRGRTLTEAPCPPPTLLSRPRVLWRTCSGHGSTGLCLQTPLGRLPGLCERLVVGFARRIALMRLGSAGSVRRAIHGAPLRPSFQTEPKTARRRRRPRRRRRWGRRRGSCRSAGRPSGRPRPDA